MKRYHMINGVPHEDPSGQWVRADEAAELERRVEGEIAEFNAGYEAAVAGLPPDEPLDTKHGQWMVGYAWGKWPSREKADRIAELERRLAMATSWLIGEPWEDDAVRIERTDDCRGEFRVMWRRDDRVESELYPTLEAALAAAEENRDGR